MGTVVLALDVGDARIGLARGELGSPFAFGRGYLERRTLPADIEALRHRMAEEGAELLVVGLPRHRDGTDSPQTKKVRDFGAALEEAGLRAVFEDERFTTRAALDRISRSGLPRGKRQEKGRVDEASAVLILESYLARHARAKHSQASQR